MNRYNPSNIRLVAGFAAVAMTAFTFTMFVYTPASLSLPGHEVTTLATSSPAAPPKEVAIHPARIEVIGIRDSDVASLVLPDAASTDKARD